MPSNTTQYNIIQHRTTQYLPLINQAGGLYGRILTKVWSTYQVHWGLCSQSREDSSEQTD